MDCDNRGAKRGIGRGVEVGRVALNLAKDDDVAHVVARAVVWVKKLCARVGGVLY
jgi:hypothetical protein